jgi:chromosome segregation ATPase
LPDVEHALIEKAHVLSKPPIVHANLTELIAAAREKLFHLDGQIDSLVNTIERSPSAALSKRLAAREAEAEALKAELEQLMTRAADTESRVVKLRATRLSAALAQLEEKPATVAAANSALRECMDSVVVNYSAGVLNLHWRHGAVTSLAVPSWFPSVKRD